MKKRSNKVASGCESILQYTICLKFNLTLKGHAAVHSCVLRNVSCSERTQSHFWCSVRIEPACISFEILIRRKSHRLNPGVASQSAWMLLRTGNDAIVVVVVVDAACWHILLGPFNKISALFNLRGFFSTTSYFTPSYRKDFTLSPPLLRC